MMNSHHNGNGHQPTVDFDYAAIDANEFSEIDVDADFWAAQGELFGDILRWLTVPKKLTIVGARVYLLALYLRPELISQASLNQISRLKDAPSRSCLSKVLLELEEKYRLRPCMIQKPAWARERFARSTKLVHRHGAQGTAH